MEPKVAKERWRGLWVGEKGRRKSPGAVLKRRKSRRHECAWSRESWLDGRV